VSLEGGEWRRSRSRIQCLPVEIVFFDRQRESCLGIDSKRGRIAGDLIVCGDSV